MAKTWYDSTISLDPIKDQTIAVIGYGIQGHAQASNMKDSGLKIIVGARKGGSSWKQATKDGHRVMEVPDACADADIIHILIPDMVQAKVYRDEIKDHLKKGRALGFSHGAAVHWKWIKPPTWVDVIMVAPKSPGQRIRELYKENFGVPALVAVDQDYTKKGWSRILGMAKGVGCARAGLIKTTFKEEVETDWFGEQVDLCGGVDAMIRNAFETLIDNGYQPEVAYFECLHELKLIVDLIQRYGIAGMYRRVSETARYGGLTRGDRVMSKEVGNSMKKTLKEVQSGKFAKEWVDVYAKKGPNSFEDLLRKLDQHPIEKVGRGLRKMMWPNQTIS
ncbi:MAG: ketol-acid reductoisomerase [Thaumarchaeota archaeon]|nr:ketol-acid reductoisomerase [Nitrososphaerota archaeon]